MTHLGLLYLLWAFVLNKTNINQSPLLELGHFILLLPDRLAGMQRPIFYYKQNLN